MDEIENGILILRKVSVGIYVDEYFYLVDEYLKSKLRPLIEPKLKEYKNMITQEQLDNWFTFHTPTDSHIVQYQRIRDYGRRFAEIILDNTPPSADQTDAIRKIRETVWTANASIACGGK